MSDKSEVVKQVAEEFVTRLGAQAEVEVEFDQADANYLVHLKSDDPGVLIGYHGETLSALQTLLGQHLKAQTTQWLNVFVNVNDYKQRREQTLKQLADNTVEQVVATGRAHTLPPMPAAERRIVHLHLADHPQVKTESAGEGRSRSVIISLKT